MSRTLLIGLDGATFTLLDPLMASGVMPFLKRFTEGGVRAELLSTPCPVTPPAWTSVMTGRSPGNHGVYDFISVGDEIGDRVAFRLVNGRDVRCETVWSVAARQGKLAGVLNYPASYHLPEFPGYVVPGFVTSRLLRSSTRPRAFWDTIKNLAEFDPKDAAWDLDQGRKPLGRGLDDDKDFLEWTQYLKRKERGWCAATKALLATTPCALISVVFEGVDRLQHQAWSLLDPAYARNGLTPRERELQDSAMDYYRVLDGLLKDLVSSAGDDARSIIISDHGFGPTTEVFYANVWLAKQGYLRWIQDAEKDTAEMLTAHNMRDHFATIDWPRTVAYARTTSANGIYIRVAKGPGAPGIAPEDYASFRAELMEKLLAYRDPETDEPVITKIMTREEAFPGKAVEDAPDLTVTLRDGGFISILNARDVWKRRQSVKGTHRPEGILIAGGRGIRRGAALSRQSILDVAPTCLYSLGLDVPVDFEGTVMTELFDPAYVEKHNVRVGGTTIDPDEDESSRREAGMDAQSEATVLERLKALGYVE